MSFCTNKMNLQAVYKSLVYSAVINMKTVDLRQLKKEI